MDILRHRPLFACCLAFMAAAMVGFALSLAGKVFLGGAALLVGCGCLLLRWGKGNRGGALCALAAAVLVCLSLAQSHLTFQSSALCSLREREGNQVKAEGVITHRVASGGSLTGYRLSLTAVDGEATQAVAYLTCHYVSDLQPGDEVTLTATLLPLEEATGDADRAASLLGDGYVVGLLSEGEESVTVTGTNEGLSVRIGAFRRRLSARLELLTGKESAGLASALLLGETSHLGVSLRRDYARAGVSHLLAISGLHVTLLFGLLDRLLRRLRLFKGLRGPAVCACALGYLTLLGFPPSATRAVIMLGMVYLSALCSRRADSLTSLGLAGALILAADPFAVADAGFWMSFLATLGIVTLIPPLQKAVSEKRGLSFPQRALLKLILALAVGVVAVSFTLQVVAMVIGELGLLSPLSTVLLTPLCGGVLLLSLLTLLLSATPLATPVGLLTGMVCDLMNQLTAWLGSPTYAVISLRHPAVLIIGGLIVGATLTLLIIRLPQRNKGMVLLPILAGWVLLGGASCLSGWLTRNEVDMSYLQPSSQSEAIVLVKGQRGFVCDLSNGSLSALSASAREAEKRGATELSVLMLTHYHTRTPGALSTLLGRETVRELWLPTPADGDDYLLLLACLEKAEAAKVPAYLYDPGETLRIFDTGRITLATATLSRSVQPVLLVSVSLLDASGEGHEWLYCGSAVFESVLAKQATELASAADTVIFGSHGPVCKAVFGDSMELKEARTVLFSAYGDVAPWIDPEAVPEGVTLWLGPYTTTVSVRKGWADFP